MLKNKFTNVFKEIKITILADVFIDRIIRIPNFEFLLKKIKEKSKVGGGSIRQISQKEVIGGNATNIAYALAKLGAQVNLFVIADDFTKELLNHRFNEYENVQINIIKGQPGFTVALETKFSGKESNIMLSDVGGIKYFDGSEMVRKFKKTFKQSDVTIISNWASNLNGNDLIKNVFSITNNSIRLLDCADISTSVDRLPKLIDDIIRKDLVDIISLNENECSVLSQYLGFKKLSENYSVKDIKDIAVSLSSHLNLSIEIHTPLGSCSASDNDVHFVKSFEIQPIRLTGAGDVWNAANVLGIKKEISVEKRLNFANACAAIYVSSFQNNDFDLSDVDKFYNPFT